MPLSSLAANYQGDGPAPPRTVVAISLQIWLVLPTTRSDDDILVSLSRPQCEVIKEGGYVKKFAVGNGFAGVTFRPAARYLRNSRLGYSTTFSHNTTFGHNMVFSDDTTSGHDTTFVHNTTFSYNTIFSHDTTSDHDKTFGFNTISATTQLLATTRILGSPTANRN